MQKLIDECRSALKKVCDCTGCDSDHNCGDLHCPMCQVLHRFDALQQRANELSHSMSAEKQACFRLGQMDMRANAAAALADAAAYTNGIGHAVLLCGADLVKQLEVGSHD